MTPKQMRKILDYFNIEYSEHIDRLTFPCPVHDSDSEESSCVYLDSAVWKCWSNSCEKEIFEDGKPRGANITGLVRGLLNDCSYGKAIKKISQILDDDISKIKVDEYDKNVHKWYYDKYEHPIICESSYILEMLSIPSPYFLKRGFSEEILIEFGVGECTNSDKEMFGRAVAPIFDSSKKNLIGCVGRSVYGQCHYCKLYHPSSHCPRINNWYKWKNSNGFKSESYLYGWWNKRYASKQNTAILVEGQGDVWKLNQAGFKNSFGLFSDKLTNGQLAMLESLFIENIIIATDNDEKGLEAATKIERKLLGKFYTKIIHPTKKDWGDMTIEEIHRCLK